MVWFLGVRCVVCGVVVCAIVMYWAVVSRAVVCWGVVSRALVVLGEGGLWCVQLGLLGSTLWYVKPPPPPQGSQPAEVIQGLR